MTSDATHPESEIFENVTEVADLGCFGEAEPRLRLLETARAYAMWNVDTPAPPAGSTPPTGNETMNKERTTAAGPTVPLEKTPAAGLPTPPEGRAFSKPRGW